MRERHKLQDHEGPSLGCCRRADEISPIYLKEGCQLFYFTNSSAARVKTEQKRQQDALVKAKDSVALTDNVLIVWH